MSQTSQRLLKQLTLAAGAALVISSCNLPAQRNGGGKGGSNSSPDIASRIVLKGPASAGGSGGELRSDHANPTNEYRNGVDRVGVEVGSNRNIGLLIDRRSSRRLVLDLGDELLPMAGDNPSNLPVVTFGPNIPDPSLGPDGKVGGDDDGEISEVELRIAHRENVSDLGVRPNNEWTPNYCWPDNTEVAVVDPDDPLTFRRMCTTMRMDFKVGAHQWRLYFGAPTARASSFYVPTHPDTGPVVVERIFPNWNPNVDPTDPTDPTVPWVITVEPWQTSNVLHPRYGAVVGYLHYRGTQKQEPWRYVGAFDVSWASADPNVTPWLVYALR